MRARLAGMGGAVLPGLPADFTELIAAETEMWAKWSRSPAVSGLTPPMSGLGLGRVKMRWFEEPIEWIIFPIADFVATILMRD
jgi:hypothetical protein